MIVEYSSKSLAAMSACSCTKKHFGDNSGVLFIIQAFYYHLDELSFPSPSSC